MYSFPSGAHQEITASFGIPGGSEIFPFRNYPRRNCPLANPPPPSPCILWMMGWPFLIWTCRVGLRTCVETRGQRIRNTGALHEPPRGICTVLCCLPPSCAVLLLAGRRREPGAIPIPNWRGVDQRIQCRGVGRQVSLRKPHANNLTSALSSAGG